MIFPQEYTLYFHFTSTSAIRPGKRNKLIFSIIEINNLVDQIQVQQPISGSFYIPESLSKDIDLLSVIRLQTFILGWWSLFNPYRSTLKNGPHMIDERNKAPTFPQNCLCYFRYDVLNQLENKCLFYQVFFFFFIPDCPSPPSRSITPPKVPQIVFFLKILHNLFRNY